MRRFLLALLLLLAAGPTPVAAEEGASGERLTISARFEHAEAIARAGSGLDLVAFSERVNSPTGSSLPRTLAPDPGAALRHAALVRVRAARQRSAGDEAAPFCERLPYHATAPPPLR